MTSEEVKKKRCALDIKVEKLRKEQHTQMMRLTREYRKLEEACPHLNTGSGSYVRWCNDCGKSWDTT